MLRKSLTLLAAGLSLVPLAITAALANAFDPPPNQDAPRSTAGGGSRPAEALCGQNIVSGQQAIALAPENFVSLSARAAPTLWIYLPATEAESTQVKSIEVSLFDEQLNGLIQTEISLAEKTAAGLVPIAITDLDTGERFSLPVGETYYWSAALVCNPNRRTEDWVVGGWIKYQPSDSAAAQQLQRLSLLDKSTHYLNAGYWYDALTTLLSTPVDATPVPQQAWATLFEQASIAQDGIDLTAVSNHAPLAE